MDVDHVLEVPVLHVYDDYCNTMQLEQELSEQVLDQETPEVHVGLPFSSSHEQEQVIAQEIPEVLVPVDLSQDRRQEQNVKRTAPPDR